MGCEIDVISIGALSANFFWDERVPVRPSHATTTLIRDGQVSILVDPSLPAEILSQRLHERTGLQLDDIDTVFLTSFRPVHRRSLEAFPRAQWKMAEDELDAVIQSLDAALDGLHDPSGSVSNPNELEQELALARKIAAAPDVLTENVHLFPSPGVTVGSAALLAASMKTWIIAGDAILTREHFHNGRIFERSADPERAKESFKDIVEVADVIVPGHDNVIIGL